LVINLNLLKLNIRSIQNIAFITSIIYIIIASLSLYIFSFPSDLDTNRVLSSIYISLEKNKISTYYYQPGIGYQTLIYILTKVTSINYISISIFVMLLSNLLLFIFIFVILREFTNSFNASIISLLNYVSIDYLYYITRLKPEPIIALFLILSFYILKFSNKSYYIIYPIFFALALFNSMVSVVISFIYLFVYVFTKNKAYLNYLINMLVFSFIVSLIINNFSASLFSIKQISTEFYSNLSFNHSSLVYYFNPSTYGAFSSLFITYYNIFESFILTLPEFLVIFLSLLSAIFYSKKSLYSLDFKYLYLIIMSISIAFILSNFILSYIFSIWFLIGIYFYPIAVILTSLIICKNRKLFVLVIIIILIFIPITILHQTNNQTIVRIPNAVYSYESQAINYFTYFCKQNGTTVYIDYRLTSYIEYSGTINSLYLNTENFNPYYPTKGIYFISYIYITQGMWNIQFPTNDAYKLGLSQYYNKSYLNELYSYGNILYSSQYFSIINYLS